jgi:hypothetical protein
MFLQRGEAEIGWEEHNELCSKNERNERSLEAKRD